MQVLRGKMRDEHTIRAVETIADLEHGRGSIPPLAHELFSQI